MVGERPLSIAYRLSIYQAEASLPSGDTIAPTALRTTATSGSAEGVDLRNRASSSSSTSH